MGRTDEMANASFEAALESHHRALEAFMAGDTGPLKAIYSRRDDATLANPFGGIAVGWGEIPDRLDRAASNYRDGELVRAERIVAFASADVGYTVEIEEIRGRVGGEPELRTIRLRVSSVFRLEDGEWRLVHRHADPRAAVQAPESIVIE